jgi:hypothetical protein
VKVNTFKIPIGVVAHIDRKDIALSLVEEVGAECISIDEQNRGAGWNHAQVLKYLRDSPTEWVVILEDDAAPTGNFRSQLEEALNWAPTPFVGLYLGRGRPPHWQAGISEVIAKESCWLLCDTLMNAVGYAVKTKLVPSVLDSLEYVWGEPGSKLPIDEAISWFGQDYGIPFCYTRPSLINHLDIAPVEKHGYGTPTEKRVAWLFGERQSWNGSTTSLEYVKSW